MQVRHTCVAYMRLLRIVAIKRWKFYAGVRILEAYTVIWTSVNTNATECLTVTETAVKASPAEVLNIPGDKHVVYDKIQFNYKPTVTNKALALSVIIAQVLRRSAM